MLMPDVQAAESVLAAEGGPSQRPAAVTVMAHDSQDPQMSTQHSAGTT